MSTCDCAFHYIEVQKIYDFTVFLKQIITQQIVLTDQRDYKKVRNYWKWLKNKLNAEGSEVVSVTNQLKLIAPNGKMRLTDVVDTEQVFRIIQSIPTLAQECCYCISPSLRSMSFS